MAVAAEFDCRWAIPTHPDGPDKNVDWNDIHCKYGGLGLVRKQISEFLALDQSQVASQVEEVAHVV